MIGLVKCEKIKIRNKFFWVYIIFFLLLDVIASNIISTQKMAFDQIDVLVKNDMKTSLEANFFFLYGVPFLTIFFLAVYAYLENENNGWTLIRISGGKLIKTFWAKEIVVFCFAAYMYLCEAVVLLGYAVIDGCHIFDMDFWLGYVLSFICTCFNVLLFLILFSFIKNIVINIVIGILWAVVNIAVAQSEISQYIITTYYYRILSSSGNQIIHIVLVCVLGIVFLNALLRAGLELIVA